jgi:hypothetical protein
LSFTDTDRLGGNQDGGRALRDTKSSQLIAFTFENERVIPMVSYSQRTVLAAVPLGPTDAGACLRPLRRL